MSRHELWLSNDRRKRYIYLKFELKKKLLKSIKLNTQVVNYRRYWAYFYLLQYPQFSRKILMRNRCITSGRVHSVNSKLALSRFTLRKKLYQTNLPGFRRASW